MKHNRLSYIMVGAALAMAPAAASAQVTPRLADDKIAVENTKVGKSADNLMVTFDLNLDSLRLRANHQFVFTPVVKDRQNSRELPQIVVNGRRSDISYRRHGNKDFAPGVTAVRRKNGTDQTVPYSAVLPYEEWMKNSNVVIAEDLCGCGDTLDRNEVELKRLRQPLLPFLRPAAEAQKARKEEGRAFIDFPVDRTELHPDYRNNPRELDKIVQTINLVKNDKNTTISSIEIHGYASPEASWEHNTRLAQGRAKTLKDHVRQLVSLDDRIFTVKSTPEDWAGLREYVAKSNIDNRDDILAVIDDTSLQPDAREWRIKQRWPEQYRYLLRNCYPALRHSDYVVSYIVKPFSVEEAKEVLLTNPKQLSLEEMFLVAQTYEPGSNEFNDVMETAVRLFPADPTANLNAACTRMAVGDLDGAEAYLAKAGSSARATHARGVIAMLRGDADQARTLLRQAVAAGDADAQKNLDILDM